MAASVGCKMSDVGRNIESPSCGLAEPEKEGHMSDKERTETREQTLEKIEFYLPSLTNEQLRMVSGFIRGIKKG